MIRIDSGNDISSVDNDDVTNECNSKTAVILIIWTGELFAKNTHLKRNEEKKKNNCDLDYMNGEIECKRN